MKQGRISQTALKVALSLITLNIKDDWAQRLPPGLVGMTERLLLASGSPGYGPRLMELSKQQWMIRIYQLQDRLLIPGQFEGFGHRKIFVQEQVEAAIKKGASQVLIVGAGFDTLCLRLAPQHPGVQFFEVDHPATSASKAQGIELEGKPPNLTQIAADLGERPLSVVLSEAISWQPSVASVFVAEGVFQYLTDEQVRELLGEAASCSAAGSRFVFTHSIPGLGRVLPILTGMVGERWKSGVRSEDLPAYIEGTAWKIVSSPDTDASHGVERYAVAEQT